MPRMLLLVATLLMPAIGRAHEPAVNKGGSQAAVVYLHGGRGFALQTGKQVYQGLLARELARQSMLIAARDELSCTTRDLHLGQSPPEAECHQLDLVGVAGEPSRLELLRGEPPRQELLATEKLALGAVPSLAALATDLEARSRGSFVAQLKQAGVKGSPRPWNAKAKVPADVESLLSEMNFITQWRAVCALHAEIGRHGQSPALLAALVRAYANLGVLTELYWCPAHEVFTARSLLYAQRLHASGREPQLSLESRAYAYALAGLPIPALEDLAALEKISKSKPSDKENLSQLLGAYCRFQFSQLESEKYDESFAELCHLLRFLAREQGASQVLIKEEGLRGAELMPHCYRMNLGIAFVAGIGIGHGQVMTEGPAATIKTMYPRLLAMAELPDDVRAVAREALPRPARLDRFGDVELNYAEQFAARAKLIAALRAAKGAVGEQDEQTWSVLAHLLSEHSFAEIWNRAAYARRLLAVPVEDWLAASQPLYEHHPYAPILQAYREDVAIARKAVAESAAIDLDTIEPQAGDILSMGSPEGAPQRLTLADGAMLSHIDATAADLARNYHRCNEHIKQSLAPVLLKLHPQSPLARVGMVTYHWEHIKDQAEAWLRDGEQDADLLVAFGRHYLAAKQYDKAVERFRQACDASPRFANFRWLAETYRLQDKMTEWQSALEESLNYPAQGLEHAQVHAEIARYYMARGEWETALPHAQGAASSYSSWGLLLAAECYEALQRWDDAEKLYRATAERYNHFNWFYYTQRTGKGDRAAALGFAKSLLEGAQGPRYDKSIHIFFSIVADVPTAIRLLQDEFAKDGNNVVFGLHLALLADEEGDAAKRDAALQRVIDGDASQPRRVTPQMESMIALAETLKKDLAAGGKCKFDAAALEAARKKAELDTTTFDYVLGRYYDLRGKPDEARETWFKCMASLPISGFNRSLAGMRLVEAGVDPEAYHEQFLKARAKPQE